jgi:hypothetical protein
LILFSELSLTGYEQKLARELASTAGDRRLHVFQELAEPPDDVMSDEAAMLAAEDEQPSPDDKS